MSERKRPPSRCILRLPCWKTVKQVRYLYAKQVVKTLFFDNVFWQCFATSGAKLECAANIIYNHMMKSNILKAGLPCFELWKHIEQSNFWKKLGRTFLLLPSLGCVWINSSLASQTLQAVTSSYSAEGFWKALCFIKIKYTQQPWAHNNIQVTLRSNLLMLLSAYKILNPETAEQ